MTPIEKTLIDLYVQFNTPVNELPYTETLASITTSINTKQSAFITAGTVWNMLVYMEKSGKLPHIEKIDLIDFAVAQQYKTIADQKIDDELMTYTNKSLVENVEAIVGGPHGEGFYSADCVIDIVKDAFKRMSKKES